MGGKLHKIKKQDDFMLLRVNITLLIFVIFLTFKKFLNTINMLYNTLF